jgi:hypothetical protein
MKRGGAKPELVEVTGIVQAFRGLDVQKSAAVESDGLSSPALRRPAE